MVLNDIGTIQVTLRLNDQLTRQMQASISQMVRMSKSFQKMDFSNLSKGNFAQFFNNIEGGVTGAQNQFVNLDKSITDTTNQTANTLNKNGKKMVNDLVNSFKNMKKGVVGQLLDFKTFISQIIHYITFSIGVQMVMKIKQGINDSIESFKAFERAAANAASVSGYMGASFDLIMKKMMQMSKVLSRETVYSAKEIQDAFYQIASAGVDIGKVTKNQLIPILNYAAATQSDLAKATEDVLTTMFAFGMAMDDTTRIVDVFTEAITSSFFNMQKMSEFMTYAAPIAGALGVSLEETVAAGMLLVNMGMAGSQAGERLNMILTRLLEPTDKAEEELAGIGLTLEDINPEIYTLTEILLKLRSAGFGASEAAAMFRARTASAATVLVENVYSIERYNQALLMSQGITESVADAQEGTFYGSMKSMSNAVEELYIAIGEMLAPVLVSFSNSIKSAVPEITKLVKGFVSFLPTLIQIIKYVIMFKVAMMSMKIAYGLVSIAAVIYNGLLGGMITNTGGLVGKTGLAIASFGVEKVALDSVNASLATSVTLTSMLTLGLSAVIGVAVAAGTGLFSMMDTISDMTSSTEELSLSMQKFAGKNFRDVLSGLEPWEAAVYEAEKSNKTLAESFDLISKEYERFNINIADYSGLTAFDDLIKKSIKERGVTNAGWDSIYGKPDMTKIDVYLKSIDEHTRNQLHRAKPFGDWTDYVATAFGIIPGIVKIGVDQINQYLEDSTYKQAKKFVEIYAGIDMSGVVDAEDIIAAFLGKTREQMIYDIELKAITKVLSTEMAVYDSTLNNLVSSITEVDEAEKELNAEKEKGTIGTVKLLQLEEKYTKALNKRSEASSNLMTAVANILTNLRGTTTQMDLAIQVIEDSAKASNDLEDVTRRLNEALDDEGEKVLELSEALSLYGSGSNEALNAEKALAKAIEERITLESEKGGLDVALRLAQEKRDLIKSEGVRMTTSYSNLIKIGKSEAQINKLLDERGYTEEQIMAFKGKAYEYDKNTGEIKRDGDIYKTIDITPIDLEVNLGLSKLEQDMYDLSMDLVTAREMVADATANQAIWEAKLTAFTTLQENHTKYLTENTKDYLEALLKIYDIKEKLYKLEEDQQKQYESLFEKLAEEGLLSQEIIDLYKEMEIAKGEQLKLNKPFMDIYDTLSAREKELVNSYVNGEISLSDFNSALEDYYANSDDTTKITEGQVGTITQYKEASDRLANSIDALGDKLKPLVDDLLKIGAVSSETAKAFYDIIDNQYEVSQQTINMQLEYEKLNDEIEALIGNNTRLAKSFIDEEGETLVDVFDELVDSLGLFGDIAGSESDAVDILNNLLNTTYDSLDDFNEGQIIGALSAIKIAQAMEIWEDGISGVALAEKLGIQSLDMFINDAAVAWEKEDSMVDVTRELTKAIDEFKSSMKGLRDIFVEYIKLTGGNPLEISFQFDFEDAIVKFGGFKKLMENLGKEDIDITGDMMESWEDWDWEAWARETKDVKYLLDEISEIGIDIPVTLNGEGWENWYSKLSGADRTKFADAIERYADNIELEVMWDSFNFRDYISTLSGSRLNEFLGVISAMSDTPINVIQKWDNSDWGEFLTTQKEHGADLITTLQDYFDDNTLTLFLEYDTEIERAKNEIYEAMKEAYLNLDVYGKANLLSKLGLLELAAPNPLELILPEDIVRGESFINKVRELSDEELELAIDILTNEGDFQPVLYNMEVLFGKEAGGGINDETTNTINLKVNDEATTPITDVKNLWEKWIPGIKNLKVDIDDDTGETYDLLSPLFKFGGIVGLQKGIRKTKGPTSALIGEDGAEAVIPLEGANKKYGESILKDIIPKYFPNLAFMEKGGVIGDITGELTELNTTIFDDILMVLKDIYNVLSTGFSQTFTPTIEWPESTIMPRMGVSVPAYTGGGEGEAEGTSGSLTAETDIRQGGKAINVRVYVDASDFDNAIMSFINGNNNILNRLNSLIGDIDESSGNLRNDIGKAGDKFISKIDSSVNSSSAFYKAILELKKTLSTKIKVDVNVNTNSDAMGEIAGLKSGIKETKGPTMAMIGEAGAEAVVPLEGANRKYGLRILEKIIPEYYPELMNQRGGLFNAGASNIDNSESYEENYNVLGPVYVESNNVEDMYKSLKYKYRASR